MSAESTAARRAAGQRISRLTAHPQLLVILSEHHLRRADESGPGRRGRLVRPARAMRTVIVDGYVDDARKRGASVVPASVQRFQITRWTLARGWRLGRVFEERVGDRSTDAAPALRQALDRVEARESDGIVITTLNQIGDSLADALHRIERIEAAGGIFVSVWDGLDLSTPTGRLILRLLLSLTEWGLSDSNERTMRGRT